MNEGKNKMMKKMKVAGEPIDMQERFVCSRLTAASKGKDLKISFEIKILAKPEKGWTSEDVMTI